MHHVDTPPGRRHVEEHGTLAAARANVAMVKAFERAGFETVARRRSYRRELAS